jgi:signal transduction histidine kinase
MAKSFPVLDSKKVKSRANRAKPWFIPRRSVRGRLTMLNLALLTLLFIVLCLAQYFLLANFLKNSLITSLQTEAKPVIEQRIGIGMAGMGGGPFGGGREQGAQRVLSDLNGKTTLAVIVDPTGRVIKPTSAAETSSTSSTVIQVNQSLVTPQAVEQAVNLDQLAPALNQLASPPGDLLQRALKGESGLSYTASLNGWDDAVVVLIPFTVPNPPARPPDRNNQGQNQNQGQQTDNPTSRIAVLVFAGSNAANETALADLLLINVVAFGILLLVIGLVSPLVAGSSLRPLRRMITTTQEIAGGDLSHRVQIESDRDEVGRLAVSFNRMVDQLEHQFKMQRQLVADASHELRTPLTAIKGSLEVMLLGGTASNPEAADRLLKTMHKESVRLTQLVNDLLTLSKLDQGESILLQPVNLLNLAQEVKASIELFIEQGEKPVSLGLEGFPAPYETPAWVMGSPERLKQVLYNLLDNAVKFSPPYATVTLELKAPATLPARSGQPGFSSNRPYYCLAVRDQGSGIPPQDLPHIFDRFYRGDASRSRRNGGSGLGLAIVQALLAAQGGFVEVESYPGQGTVFYIYLPAVTEISPAPVLPEKSLSPTVG